MIQILDGKIIRDNLVLALKQQVANLPCPPRLAIVQIGNLPESNKYIKNKIKFAEKIGALTSLHLLNNDTTEIEIIKLIEQLNADVQVNGIIVQLPLPKHLNTWKIIEHIRSDKDVDGLTSQTKFIPATARGVMTLLNYYQISLLNKRVVVMGQSKLVGDPIRKALESIGGQVSVVHSKTPNPKEITQQADILIVAIGKAGLVDESYIKPGVIIVDIGINLVEGNLVGDVDFGSVKNIAAAISPVPGGVGPLTVVSLFQNLLDASK